MRFQIVFTPRAEADLSYYKVYEQWVIYTVEGVAIVTIARIGHNVHKDMIIQ